ncbi:MAG: type VI secretion system tube protein Hcp [Pikeienuella sp.]
MADSDPWDAFIYFKPSGKIRGETSDDVLSKETAIELTEFTLKAENATAVSSATKGVGGAGKVKFEKVSFKKRTDTATMDLWHHLCAGTQFTDAIVEIRRNGQKFLEYKFVSVILSEVETTQSGDDEAEDSVVIDWGAMTGTYWYQDPGGDGTSMKQGGTAEWSRTKNKNIGKI